MNNPTIGLEAARQVGEILKQARQGSGLSLTDVADRAGMSERRLRQILTGVTQRTGGITTPTVVPRDRLVKLFDILKIDMGTADRILRLAGYQPLDNTRDAVYLGDLPVEAQLEILAIKAKYGGRGPQ